MFKLSTVYILILSIAILFSSCATVLTGTHQPIQVDTSKGESAYLNGAKIQGEDSIVKVKRSMFKKKKFEIVNDQDQVTKKYRKGFNEVSLLNFIVFPFWLVDIITGSVVKYKDKDQNK